MLSKLIIAAILNVAGASDDPSKPLPVTEASEPQSAEARVAGGWLKTFATEPIEPGASFETPDYFGSLTETSVRAAMRRALLDMGFVEEGSSGGDIVTISVAVSEPKPKSGAKGLPRSPIRLEGVDSDPTDNIHDPEVRPMIAIPTGKKAPSAAPQIEVTIYARRGDRRIWSGYAGAPANGGSREQLALGLASALLAHFGETINVPEAEIALDVQSSAKP
jgi:hypothetical protein